MFSLATAGGQEAAGSSLRCSLAGARRGSCSAAMKVAALDRGSLLAKLRRAPPPPSPHPPAGGGCAPSRAVPPGAAAGRPLRPAPDGACREPVGRAGSKALLITLPDIGEEAAAESDGEEAARIPRRPG